MGNNQIQYRETAQGKKAICWRCQGNVDLASKSEYRKQKRYCDKCHEYYRQRMAILWETRYDNSCKGRYHGFCVLCGVDEARSKQARTCTKCYNLLRTAEFRYLIRTRDEQIRKCIGCGTTKMHTNSRCRACQSDFQRFKKYFISKEELDAMLLAQENKCAICSIHIDNVKYSGKSTCPLVIDHDHKTGKVRALLCRSCNSHLGWFDRRPEVLYKTIEYLRRHQSLLD